MLFGAVVTFLHGTLISHLCLTDCPISTCQSGRMFSPEWFVRWIKSPQDSADLYSVLMATGCVQIRGWITRVIVSWHRIPQNSPSRPYICKFHAISVDNSETCIVASEDAYRFLRCCVLIELIHCYWSSFVVSVLPIDLCPVSGTPVKFNRQLNRPVNWRLDNWRFNWRSRNWPLATCFWSRWTVTDDRNIVMPCRSVCSGIALTCPAVAQCH